jgi:hypothetical protein
MSYQWRRKKIGSMEMKETDSIWKKKLDEEENAFFFLFSYIDLFSFNCK